MRIKRKDLQSLIIEYLHEDSYISMNEGRMGAITVGPKFEFCDLSERIPNALVEFFKMFRGEGKKQALEQLIIDVTKDVDMSREERDEEIKNINKQIEDLSNAGTLEALAGSSIFGTMFEVLGPTLSFVTLADKTTCDYLIDMIFAFTRLTLLPILKTIIFISGSPIDTSGFERALGASEVREQQRRSGGNTNTASAIALTPSQKFEQISSEFASRRVTDSIKRNSVEDDMINLGLTHTHFDLFELFAVSEYNDFTNDPTEEIPSSAVDKFKSAGRELRANGETSFSGFINSYVLSTEGTLNDASVKSTLSSSNLEESFNTPKDASDFIQRCLNQLIHSNLDFEGVTFLTTV